MPELYNPGLEALKASQQRTKQMEQNRFKLMDLGMAKQRLEQSKTQFEENKKLQMQNLELARERFAQTEVELGLKKKQEKRLDDVHKKSKQDAIYDQEGYDFIGKILQSEDRWTDKFDKMMNWKDSGGNYYWRKHIRELQVFMTGQHAWQKSVYENLIAAAKTATGPEKRRILQEASNVSARGGGGPRDIFLTGNSSITEQISVKNYLSAGTSLSAFVEADQWQTENLRGMAEGKTPEEIQLIRRITGVNLVDPKKSPEEIQKIFKEAKSKFEALGSALTQSGLKTLFITTNFGLNSQTNETVVTGIDINDPFSMLAGKIPSKDFLLMLHGDKSAQQVYYERLNREALKQTATELNSSKRKFSAEVEKLIAASQAFMTSKTDLVFTNQERNQKLADELGIHLTQLTYAHLAERDQGILEMYVANVDKVKENELLYWSQDKDSEEYEQALEWKGLSKDEKIKKMAHFTPYARDQRLSQIFEYQWGYLHEMYGPEGSFYDEKFMPVGWWQKPMFKKMRENLDYGSSIIAAGKPPFHPLPPPKDNPKNKTYLIPPPGKNILH